MYAQYVKEREGLDEIKTDKGFIHYRIDGDMCIINDYFVLPGYRRSYHGQYLADRVFSLCKAKGVKNVWCQSDERAGGHDTARKSILKFGFKEINKTGTIYLYAMEVSQWEKPLAQPLQ